MKGMLFKPDMIQSIRDKRKTVTRRTSGLKEINQQPDKWDYMRTNNDGRALFWRSSDTASAIFNDPDNLRLVKPRYQVGETVYIKEAWAEFPELNGMDAGIGYKADIDNCGQVPVGNTLRTWDKVRPRSPLFLPEKYARYFLKITDVRAERLLLPLSPEELELEGGEAALIMLEKLNGLWVFRYQFEEAVI